MGAGAATLVRPRRSQAAAQGADGRLSLVRDPLRAALFMLTVLTISRVHENYPLLAKFRPALLLVIASVGYAYLNPRYLTRSNVLRLWPTRLVALLGVIACCSAAFGISLGGSASFILNSYSKTLAYTLLVALSIRHVRDLFTFVWAYVVSCGILAFFSIFVFGITKASNSYVTRLNDLYTYDSNDLGVVMMVGLPLTLLLLSVERGTRRFLLVLILIGISVTMARSGSRGGFLGFAAVGVAALILVRGVSPSKRLAVFAAAAIALVAGAPAGYWKQMATILSPKDDYNYFDPDGRKAVMERGIGYTARYPVFGLGIDNFPKAECTISPKIQAEGNGPIRCIAPHNSYVEAASETGTLGFVVWVSLVIGCIVAPLRLGRRLPRRWGKGTPAERFIYGATSFFPVSMIGFAVTAFFVSFAWRDPIYLMASLLTGLYVSAQSMLAREAHPAAAVVTPLPKSAAGWRVARSMWRTSSGGGLQSGMY